MARVCNAVNRRRRSSGLRFQARPRRTRRLCSPRFTLSESLLHLDGTLNGNRIHSGGASASSGPILPCHRAWVREEYHAPRAFAVFTSVGGFAEGLQICTLGSMPSEDAVTDHAFTLPDSTAYAALTGPVEFRIHFYGSQYAHRAQITFNRIADPALTCEVWAGDENAPSDWALIWSSTGEANTAGPVTVPDDRPAAAWAKPPPKSGWTISATANPPRFPAASPRPAPARRQGGSAGPNERAWAVGVPRTRPP